MKWEIHNVYGLFHVITATIAMISAIIVLLSKKGTVFHKKVGYVYISCIVLLNISSFGVMEFVKGQPGPFHFGAIISLIFTALGIIPAIRKTNKNWLRKHYYYINGSVIGLFSAFFVESVFRSFESKVVVTTVTIAISMVTAIVGTLLMLKYRSRFFAGPKL